MIDERPTTEVDEIAIVRDEAGQGAEEGAETGLEEPASVTESTTPEPSNDAYAGLLQPHPDPGLIEQDPVGPLPITGSDGREPWRVYSRPSNPIETRPRIAIVIAGLGINKKETEAALNLSGDVSLAFVPYASGLAEWINKARENGHETLLTLPMEPSDFPKSDPGPFALMSTLDTEQNTKRLEWILSRATGYIGLISYQGSGFSANNKAVRPLMGNLKSRGLLYIDAKQTIASTAPAVARAAGVPNAQADIILDQKLSRAEILKQLKLTESLARANGTVIAVGHPYPVTLDRLRIWIADLPETGFVLAPVSGIVEKRRQE
ncbi:MAG: divergent polysaccharide deacetylase family protein [Alphaproteobacteria bacterium]